MSDSGREAQKTASFLRDREVYVLVFLNCNSEIFSDDLMIDPAASFERCNYISTSR